MFAWSHRSDLYSVQGFVFFTLSALLAAALVPADAASAANADGLKVRYFNNPNIIKVWGTDRSEHVKLSVDTVDGVGVVTVTSEDTLSGDPAQSFTDVLDCTQVSSVEVQCPGPAASSPDEWQVGVFLRDEADQVEVTDEAARSSFLIIGGSGNDNIDVDGGTFASIFGKSGADVIDSDAAGEGGFNVVRGGEGPDVIAWRHGSQVYGGRGADHLSSTTASDDVVRGGRGNDVIRPSSGSDVTYGGPGADRIVDVDGDDDDINCGRDRDTAKVDWRDLTYRCERVVVAS